MHTPENKPDQFEIDTPHPSAKQPVDLGQFIGDCCGRGTVAVDYDETKEPRHSNARMAICVTAVTAAMLCPCCLMKASCLKAALITIAPTVAGEVVEGAAEGYWGQNPLPTHDTGGKICCYTVCAPFAAGHTLTRALRDCRTAPLPHTETGAAKEPDSLLEEPLLEK